MHICLSQCRRDASQRTKRRTAHSSDAPRPYRATAARRGRLRPTPTASCCCVPRTSSGVSICTFVLVKCAASQTNSILLLCVSPASYRQHEYPPPPSKASTFVIEGKKSKKKKRTLTRLSPAARSLRFGEKLEAMTSRSWPSKDRESSSVMPSAWRRQRRRLWWRPAVETAESSREKPQLLKPASHLLRCQYLYFCTSKASKLT